MNTLIKYGSMKKIISIGALMLVVLMGVVMIGCDNKKENGLPKADNVAKLDPAVETQVRQDYFNQVISPADNEAQLSDIQIYRYYGTFNGYVVIMFNDGARQAVGEETVVGITINYMDSRRIIVWKDGSFNSLLEAFENSFLTEQNIKVIADAQNNG